jgi:aspartyl-tRNA(Asn)/glutamyl-tRNA(Gln) amidotransferase subunit A
MNPFSTIKELKVKLEQKEISPRELRQFYADRIRQHNPSLNAVLEVFEDEPSNISGPLGGIPGLLKDNICQLGKAATAGSNILKGYTAPYDSTANSRLKAAGYTPLGRTNCDEFGMGGSGEYSAHGASYNPYDLARVPGGSSSGSAAAVAAGLVPFALGTETGGSVRQPASFCNLVGLYPTYGHNSRFGLIAYASSNDQVGALTHTVYDNALVMSTLSGQDPRDATSLQMKPKDYTAALDGKLPAGLRVGVIKDALTAEGIDPEVRANFENFLNHLKKMGATIKEVELPNLKYGIAVYFIVTRAEAASNLSRYDGTLYGNRAKDVNNLVDMYVKTRDEGFGNEVKRRILTGNYVLSSGHKDAYYGKAIQVRNMIRAEFEAAFHDVDVLTSPTVPTLPFKVGELSNDPVAMYMADYFTVPNCMIGTPALSIPTGFSKAGLPIGMQFFGPRLSEELLYRVGYAYEQETQFYKQSPIKFT